MAGIWDNIKKKRGHGGAGNVTEKEKANIIWKADAIWDRMKLPSEQKALGIAIMNVESGFNPDAKGPSKTERGLGQFNDGTWAQAVKYYNDSRNSFRGTGDPVIDLNASRTDLDTQIKVAGAWTQRVLARAFEVQNDPAFKDENGHDKYDIIDIAYAAWHQGVSADVKKDKIVNGEPYLSLKSFLEQVYSGDALETYLHDTYGKAKDTFDLTEATKNLIDYLQSNPHILDYLPFSGNGHSGETLERDPSNYKIVRRIEPNGSERGYFLS